MQVYLNIILGNCIVIFDTELVYLKLQVTNFKKRNLYQTLNPNPRKYWSFENSKPKTLYTKVTLNPKT